MGAVALSFRSISLSKPPSRQEKKIGTLKASAKARQ
jgi:hypothetical protein